MVKSVDDYAAAILKLHTELQQLPDFHPDHEKKQEQQSRQLTAWSKKLNIVVQVANNEQQPWDSEEIGYPCIPMATKKDSQHRQVGDYIAYLDDYDMFAGVLVERKGTTRKNGRMTGCDLYQTFSNKDNRARFYREVERFKADPRFDMMVLIAECSNGEYLSFKPAFNGKNYNRTNFGMNVAARRATIAKLDVVGCSVKFMGTRHHAVEYYHDIVLQWCRLNYERIISTQGCTGCEEQASSCCGCGIH